MHFLSLCFFITAAAVFAHEFPAPVNSGNEKGAKPPMTPEEAVKSIKLPEGFKATLFAGEPDVQNPIACAWDSRGRLWVAENYTYAETDKTFDHSLRDRIVIFEDTDNDGRHDKRTVFADNLKNLTSIELGYGGVYATAAPHLLFIPDKNRDDKPDGEPEVLLDGFDAWSIRHNFVNGLKWGPDGWLYGRHGIQATSNVGRPGAPDSERVKMNCGIWRFHPVRKTFEVVCWGGTNPWGHDWNAEGEGFFTNTVTGHLYHIIPGAHYERMYGEDLNPHIYQLLPQTADHYHYDTSKSWTESRDGKANDRGGGHAHTGCMIYLGENWPEQYRGKLFTINLHGRRLNVERLERQGSGYTAKHEPDFASFEDPWFRGVDLTYGPDGGVYVLDWSDRGECHENDGVHRLSGRIYKITYGEVKKPDAGPTGDLRDASHGGLLHLAVNGSEWRARIARLLLAERMRELAPPPVDTYGKRVKRPIARVAREPNDDGFSYVFPGLGDREARVVRLLYTLLWNPELSEHQRTRVVQLAHATELLYTDVLWHGFDKGKTTARAAVIRAWADELVLRDVWLDFTNTCLNSDSKSVKAQLGSQFDPTLARTLCAVLRQADGPHVWEAIEPLLASPDLARDEKLMLCLWGAIVSGHDWERSAVARTWGKAASSLLQRHAARYMAEDYLRKRPDPADTLNKTLASMNAADVERLSSTVRGFREAFRGLSKAPKPAAWDAFATKAAQVPASATELRQLNVIFGDGRALNEIRDLALDNKADLPTRRQALESLITSKAPDLRSVCEKLIANRDLAHLAIRGLATFDDEAAAKLAIANWDNVRRDARAAAISDFATRPVFTRALLDAVASGKVAREEITPYHARQIAALKDEGITAQLTKLWGEVRTTPEAKRKRIEELKAALPQDVLAKADIDAGREVFRQACAACHRLFDLGAEGTQLGPNLTGSGRQDINYLLENIVDPNGLVPQDYKLSVITLKDGRVLSGFIAAQTEQTLTLRTMTDVQNVARADVAKTESSPNSLMPEGLLDTLAAEQVRDLFGFLMKK